MLCEMITPIVPAITEELKSQLQGVQESVKSYADVAAESGSGAAASKEMAEYVAEKAADKAVEKQILQANTNNLQRDRRKFRVVIKRVKEHEGSPKEADEADKQCLVEKIGMKEEDILNTFRAGRGTDQSGKPVIRPIIIRLPDADAVSRYTRNGIGKLFKVDKEQSELTGKADKYHHFWINKDLCAADRHVNFLERKERSSSATKNDPAEGGEHSQATPEQNT